MARNFGLTRREVAKGMRCEHQFKRDRSELRKTLLIVLITLLAVLATYFLRGEQKISLKMLAKLDHTEKLLGSYMTHGAVESDTTIYTCAAKTYEVPK